MVVEIPDRNDDTRRRFLVSSADAFDAIADPELPELGSMREFRLKKLTAARAEGKEGEWIVTVEYGR